MIKRENKNDNTEGSFKNNLSSILIDDKLIKNKIINQW